MKLLNVTYYAALSLALLSSCTDDPIYSCDKYVDAWVKENINDVRLMDRNQWLLADASKSTAIYRAFSPEQKKQFWHDKFAEVKALDWSDESRAHIEKAEAFIQKHYSLFYKTKLSDDDLDILEGFFYAWQKYGIEKLGWSKLTAQSIAACGYRVLDTQGTVAFPKLAALAKDYDCNCSRKVASDFCGYDQICKNVGCSMADFGCGWILLQDCNGRCVFAE